MFSDHDQNSLLGVGENVKSSKEQIQQSSLENCLEGKEEHNCQNSPNRQGDDP